MTDDEFLKELGHLLKFYRIKRGITQAQLGEMVEISEHRISQIENGKCNLTLKTTNKIFSALNLSPFKVFQIDET